MVGAGRASYLIQPVYSTTIPSLLCPAFYIFIAAILLVFMTPQRRSRIHEVLARRQPDLAVVMENIRDPHNIAAVMRTCDSVGIQELFVLNTPLSRHPKFGRASSRGAIKWITVHEYTDAEACADVLKQRFGRLLAAHLDDTAVTLYDLDLCGSAALVFGNEQKGVSVELLQHCSGRFIIPQMGMVRSLNVSVACAVTLYEALRQRQAAGCYTGRADAPYAPLAERWENL